MGEQPLGRSAAGSSHAGLHPLLAGRWSPTRFDTAHRISDGDVELMLEAARWAPSAGNSQPWAFIVGTNGTDIHARLTKHLAGSSRAWATDASVLVANLSHRYVQDTDWEYSEFSLYDLGQAVAHMTIQAQALGLLTRQFRAFNREALHAEFAVPEHWEIATMTAIGRPAGTASSELASGTAASPGRQRKALEDLLWPSG
jgi:nitroreductase